MTARRLASALVVGVIVAVAVAAAIDAFVSSDSSRRTGSRPTDTRETKPEPDPLVAQLSEGGIHGVLYYSDPEDECRLHAVELPSLREVPPPKLRACRFELPGNVEPAWMPRGSTWQTRGRLGARCFQGRVEVYAASGALVRKVKGCAPAWKPDGSLTVIRDGEVWGKHKLLSAADLARGAHTLSIVPPDPRFLRRATALAAAWFTDSRAAVLVRVRLRGQLRGIGPITALVIYERRRFVRAVPYSGASEFRLSPRRTFLAVREDGERVTIVDSTGRARLDTIAIPAPNALAVTWSPDERWTAVASRWSVYLIPTSDIVEGRNPRSIRLPLAARDLAWR